MTDLRRQNRGKYAGWQCALLCALTAFAAFVPFLFQEGGFFRVHADFNWQQLPFGMALHNAIADGNIGGWCWSYDVGMSTVQAFSFYALGSPFYWISLVFPASWYPYLVGWIWILKYTVAGVTAFYFLRRFTRLDRSAMIGAVMYAFSGFQAVNLLYYHFHDAVALFPLLLLGLDKILEEPKNRGTFIFAVFINAITNYYFFVMETVFCAVYFLFRRRFVRGDAKGFFRDLGNCLGCGIWGAAMAAALLLPGALYVLQSPRAKPSLLLTDLFRDSCWFLFVLRSFLLPGDTLCWQSAFYGDQYDSVAAWLPLAGLGLCLAYLLKHKWKNNSWLSRMLIVLLAVSFSPLVSSGFLLFSEFTGRWLFMLTLLAALATAKVLDGEGEGNGPEAYPVRKALLWTLAATAAFCVLVYTRPWDNQTPTLVYFPERFLIYAGIAAGGLLLLLLLRRFGKLNSMITLALVCVFAAGTTGYTLYTYRSFTGDGTDPLNVKIGEQLETHDPQYRYVLTNNQLMLPGGGSGMTVFSSTISTGVREFDELFDFFSSNRCMYKTKYPGLAELFAAKYNVRAEKGNHTPVQEITAEGNTRYVLELDACPIGFAVDHVILKDELLKIDLEKRGIALLHAAVVDPEAAEALAGLCETYTAETVPLEEDLTEIVKQNTENAVRDFTRDSRGFRCTSDFPAAKAVYFSVPMDDGWTAKIDGEKQEILSSGGMMLLQVPAGRHEIEFTYTTPGWNAGLWISVISIVAFAAYLVVKRIRAK